MQLGQVQGLVTISYDEGVEEEGDVEEVVVVTVGDVAAFIVAVVGSSIFIDSQDLTSWVVEVVNVDSISRGKGLYEVTRR